MQVALIVICVAFAYAAIGKIKSYYVKIEESDVAVKETARLAAERPVSPGLILFSKDGQFDGQSALFYSNSQVVQVSTTGQTVTAGTTNTKRWQM